MPKPRREEVVALRELLVKTGLNVIPEEDSNRIITQLRY
jgi:hypothetical protein